jgi:hypothetical protein
LHCVAEIVVSFGGSGADGDCRDRLLVMIEPGQSQCERVVCIGRGLVYPDRPPKLLRRIIVSALLQTQEAETIPSGEMTTVRVEHGLIKLFCLTQLSLLVTGERFLKCLKRTEWPSSLNHCEASSLRAADHRHRKHGGKSPLGGAAIDEIAAWEGDRNTHHTKSDWHFATKDARIKLKYLYPSI